jgi:APA family basic amino acid/polyamine antiporter
VHGERQTPVAGLLASSALVSGLVLYNWNVDFGARFTDVVLLATWMTLIAYAYAAAAEVVLFVRERELFSWAKLVRDSVIASLAFAYSLWAIWGSGQEWLAKGFMLLLLGIPVYVWLKWRQGKEPVADHPVPGPLLEASATVRPRRVAAPQEEREVRTPIGLGIE